MNCLNHFLENSTDRFLDAFAAFSRDWSERVIAPEMQLDKLVFLACHLTMLFAWILHFYVLM